MGKVSVTKVANGLLWFFLALNSFNFILLITQGNYVAFVSYAAGALISVSLWWEYNVFAPKRKALEEEYRLAKAEYEEKFRKLAQIVSRRN